MFNAFFFYFYECYSNFGWNQWQNFRSSEKRRSPVTLDGWVLCFFTNSWGTKAPCFPTIFWETYWTLLDQLGQNLKWFWNFWKGFSQLILESSFKIVVVSCCFICYVHSSKRWSISAKKIRCHKNLQPFTLAWNPNVARILPKSSNALWLHRIFRRMLMSPLKNNRTPHKPQDSPK